MTSLRPPTLVEGASAVAPMVFPCSSSQQRWWFIDAMAPGNPALNIALRWELRGSFNPATIERTFRAIIARHEVLRTQFLDVDGMPVQQVRPTLDFKLSDIDLTMVLQSRRLEEATRLARLEAQTPFDLSGLPLIRATLLRLGQDNAFLLVTIHHIAFDGWSIRLLSHEFGTIAAALDADRPHNLPDLVLQYGDYASWEEAYLSSRQFDSEANYWRRQLSGAPYFEVSGDRERPAQSNHKGEILAVTLPDELAEAMVRAARQHQVTLFGFGCAVIAAALSRFTGAEDICIGTQIGGREDADLEPVIGVFINDLVLRFDVSGDPTFLTCLDRAKRTVRDALAHRHMPFHTLVEMLKPPRDPRRMPLVSVNFTVMQDVMTNARYGDFALVGHPSLPVGSLYDLNFFMVHWPTGWRMALEYDFELFDKSTGDDLLGLWRQTLELMVRSPAVTLSAHPLVRRPSRTGPSPVAVSDRTRRSTAGTGASAGSSDASNDVKAKLIRIWQEILGVDEVRSASFFDLGGHSLLAMRMLSRVAKTFGVKINISNLFLAPTIDEFAAHLISKLPNIADWQISQIQRYGSKTPIVAINNTAVYHNLAKNLGRDRPMFGIQIFDPDAPRELEARSMEAIAADYVRLIRQLRPHGPYILMGLCVAGTIAYEAARQLRQQGESVPLVILNDTWLPGFVSQLPAGRRVLFAMAYRWHNLKRHGRNLRNGQATLAQVLATYPTVQKIGLLQFAAKLGLIDDDRLGMEDWENRWFLPHLQNARQSYQAEPVRDTLAVFRSEEINTSYVDESMGWRAKALGRLILQPIPGWHTDMFKEPGAKRIAERLLPLLAEVDEMSDRIAREALSVSG